VAGREPDWYTSETPIGRQWVTELQRLKRRARARPFTVLAVALALTGALVFLIARKPRIARARVVIAVTETDLGTGRTPTSMGELRDYVYTVLLPNAKLMPIIEENAWAFPLRGRLGDAYALSELRDFFDVAVWRNYFMYQASYDELRSARIAITVMHGDADFAVELARRLASIIIDGEAERRRAAADALAAEAVAVIEATRAKVYAVERELSDKMVAATEAELAGQRGKAIALRTEAATLSQALHNERERLDAVNTAAELDQLDAAVANAGLGMGMEIADERLPDPDEAGRALKLVIVGGLLFFLMTPLVAIVFGTFDSRIHDLDDVSRLGMPVVGHVPPFPGDTSGSLRDRGIRRRRVPSF
jgi:hypothetical protein